MAADSDERCPSGTSILELVLCASGGPGELDDNEEDFDIARDLVIFADLADALGDGPDALADGTLFLPDDEAFWESMIKIDNSIGGNYDEDVTMAFYMSLGVDIVQAVLLYHALTDEYDTDDLRDNFKEDLETQLGLGQTIQPGKPKKRGDKRIRLIDMVPSIPEPKIHNRLKDIETSNGYVHVMQAVLFPDLSALG